MPNQDAFEILANARRMGLEAASAISGASESPNLAWKHLSLSEASVGARDPEVARALNSPQSPMDPRWSMRIQPPPCEQCGNDHKGNRVYDHSYVHPLELQEAREYLEQHPDQPVQAAPTPIREGVERAIVNRVAIYDGRTGYVVKVECPPEWDDVPGSKTPMDRNGVCMVLRLCKALGVRVKNNSEDEFEEGNHADQPRRDTQDGPPRAGLGSRRSPEDSAREWAELLPGTTPPSPEPAHADGDDRPDSDGQEVRAARGAGTRKAS